MEKIKSEYDEFWWNINDYSVVGIAAITKILNKEIESWIYELFIV